MFDYKKLFFAMQILSASCFAMQQQDVMTTQVPDDVLKIIAELVSNNNVKGIFRLALVNKRLQSIFTKDLLMQQLKKLTFEHLIKAMPYDHKLELANQSASSLQIKREIGQPAVSRFAGYLYIPIHSKLNYSIYMGQLTLTKSLLEVGEQYNDQSLLVAIAVNNIDAIKVLLGRGANPAKRYCLKCLSPVAWSRCVCGRSPRFTPLEFAFTGIAQIDDGNASPAQAKLYKDIYQLLCNTRGKRLLTECQYIYQLWGDSNEKKLLGPILAVVAAGCMLYFINKLI